MRLPGIQEETAYGQILGSIYFSARQVRISKFTEDKTYMLNIGKIEEGFVLDHIKAGKSMQIYRHLGLDNMDSTVAIIKNAKSKAMGKKDKL